MCYVVGEHENVVGEQENVVGEQENVVGEQENFITAETLNRALRVTACMTTPVQLDSPWGACPPALVATQRSTEVVQHTKEDIAISVSNI